MHARKKRWQSVIHAYLQPGARESTKCETSARISSAEGKKEKGGLKPADTLLGTQFDPSLLPCKISASHSQPLPRYSRLKLPDTHMHTCQWVKVDHVSHTVHGLCEPDFQQLHGSGLCGPCWSIVCVLY